MRCGLPPENSGFFACNWGAWTLTMRVDVTRGKRPIYSPGPGRVAPKASPPRYRPLPGRARPPLNPKLNSSLGCANITNKADERRESLPAEPKAISVSAAFLKMISPRGRGHTHQPRHCTCHGVQRGRCRLSRGGKRERQQFEHRVVQAEGSAGLPSEDARGVSGEG